MSCDVSAPLAPAQTSGYSALLCTSEQLCAGAIGPQWQCPEKLLDLLLGGEPVLTCTQIYDAQIDKRQNLIFEAIYIVIRSYIIALYCESIGVEQIVSLVPNKAFQCARGRS